VSMENSVV